MIHDMQRNVLFIATGAGVIFIFNCLTSCPELITKVEIDFKNCIRGLCRSVYHGGFYPNTNLPYTSQSSNLLLVSDVNGYITIFDINSPGKEKLTKRIGYT